MRDMGDATQYGESHAVSTAGPSKRMSESRANAPAKAQDEAMLHLDRSYQFVIFTGTGCGEEHINAAKKQLTRNRVILTLHAVALQHTLTYATNQEQPTTACHCLTLVPVLRN